jgi:hypothetical protein
MRCCPLLALITACVIALPALATQAGSGLRPWARFGDSASMAAAHGIVASDAPGDAALSSLVLDGDGMLVVNGTLGLDNGSRWSTLGVEIAPATVGADTDMSEASVLRIRLAAATVRPLRVRIKGGDREIGNAGCYPVVVQMVATTPANYAIPLSAFHSPGWCGAKAVSIEQTLRSVERVEVTANDEPIGSVIFSVGQIDFLVDGGSQAGESRRPTSSNAVEGARELPADSVRLRQREEPAGAGASATAAPARVPAPASVPAPRRRPAAGGQANAASAATPSKRVVCEHSARYELMLCY